MAGIWTCFEIILAGIEINFKFIFGGKFKKDTLMSIEYLFILIYIVG